MAKKKPTARPSELDFVQEIKAKIAKIPNCSLAKSTVIKLGPQTYKLATILEFKDKSGKITHHELRLNDYPFRVDGGIKYEIDDRLAHWFCRDEEIEQLQVFLANFRAVDKVGTHRVIDTKVLPTLENILEALGDANLSSKQLLGLISALADRTNELRALPVLGEKDNARMVAAALRVAHRSRALKRMAELIATGAEEQEFQKLLDQNWWMLGGQYVERISKRHWTNRETVDLMLKSADSYFEIVELKRSTPKLFKRDHDQWVISAEVSDAVSQAANYIAFIELDRGSIFKRFKVDLHKIKAKVLIGYIGEGTEADEQREALRTFNSHLHRIEVLTYDQLIRTGENVISANAGESGQEISASVDEIPF